MTDSEPWSDPLPSATKSHAKCEKCGATIRLDTGICVNCLLREGLEGGDELSQACYQSVLAEVDAPHKSWFLGNYEILEQIGCGGMGVIYRARQRHSRRIVAVKRVLSYRVDSHEALERFRREAQAVASLDHPNILPIYEVSESEDGLPFFSRKFAGERAFSSQRTPHMCATHGKGRACCRIRSWPRGAPSGYQTGKHSAQRSKRATGQRFRFGEAAGRKQRSYTITDYVRNRRFYRPRTGRSRSRRFYPGCRCLQSWRSSVQRACRTSTIPGSQSGFRHSPSV